VSRPKQTLRDLAKAISPRWLSTGVAEKYLAVCGMALDALNEKLRQGMWAHIPTYSTDDALPFIGADRGLVQGPSESAFAFASRCRLAYDDWQHAGSAWAVLRQMILFMSPQSPAVEIVSENSVWQVYAAGSDTSQPPAITVGASNWNWDLATTPPSALSPYTGGWWRFWVILFATGSTPFAAPAPFVFGTSGVRIGQRPDASIGLNIPPSTVAGIRSIVATWKSANTWCRWIVISFDATLFDPTKSADGTHNPAGTFGNWGIVSANVMVASRFSSARYCDGVY